MHLYKVKLIVNEYKHTAIFYKTTFLFTHLLLWMNVMHGFIYKSGGIGT